MTETGTRTSRAPDLTGTGALALLAALAVVALVLVLGLPTDARTRLWALVLSVPITLGPVAVRPAAAGPLIRVR
jgi:hypothetical protein